MHLSVVNIPDLYSTIRRASDRPTAVGRDANKVSTRLEEENGFM